MLKNSKSAKFFRMALSAMFLALLAVLFNSYARLSEAGLGCPDWPGCYGKSMAPMSARDVKLAQEAENGLDPAAAAKKVERRRVFRDTVQRYLNAALGLFLIRLAVLGWQLKKRKRTQQVLIPLATMVLAFASVVVGLLTIGLQFKPLVMMTQLVGGLTILALLWWIVMREQRFWRSVGSSALTRSLRPRALIALGIVAFQIVLGGWSMVNYAGLACPDFPTCQGVYWPSMDFLDAFTRWRDLGVEYESGVLNLDAATAIHMAHRLGALISVLYAGWLSLHVLRVGIDDNLCRFGLLVLVTLLASATLGVAQVVTHLPLAVAIAHSGVAAILLMSLITLYHVVKSPRAL
jgi:cytochrome c oxidase assembly protein subunit 15